MKRFILPLAIGAMFTTAASAQYKQEEEVKHPLQKIFPETPFDSVAAKNGLGEGTVTLQGIAFTRARNSLGFKPLMGDRIYANHITVELFPCTPYFEEWYELKKTAENLKKNRVVYMDSVAYRFRLTCETNSKGAFTFPKMKPGKYILIGTLPWQSTGSYDQYTGSGYGSYGTQVNYYERQYYTISHSDFLMEMVEIAPGDESVKVRLK